MDKSIKEKFNNHYLIFGVTLIIIGFGSGFKAKEFLFSHKEEKLSSCVDEIGLRESHSDSLSTLYQKLANQEMSAAGSEFYTDRVQYIESADRLRADIDKEHERFESSLRIIRCNK